MVSPEFVQYLIRVANEKMEETEKERIWKKIKKKDLKKFFLFLFLILNFFSFFF